MSTNLESHKFLPSGKWKGFYCYNNDPSQHKMHFELTFKNGIISGSGIDDVSPFTWKGNYNLKSFKAEMRKSYNTHFVYYQGDIDEQGIWGIWEMEELDGILKGGFHIWPVSQKEEAKMTLSKEKKKSKVLEKVYVEKFA